MPSVGLKALHRLLTRRSEHPSSNMETPRQDSGKSLGKRAASGGEGHRRAKRNPLQSPCKEEQLEIGPDLDIRIENSLPVPSRDIRSNKGISTRGDSAIEAASVTGTGPTPNSSRTHCRDIKVEVDKVHDDAIAFDEDSNQGQNVQEMGQHQQHQQQATANANGLSLWQRAQDRQGEEMVEERDQREPLRYRMRPSAQVKREPNVHWQGQEHEMQQERAASLQEEEGRIARPYSAGTAEPQRPLAYRSNGQREVLGYGGNSLGTTQARGSRSAIESVRMHEPSRSSQRAYPMHNVEIARQPANRGIPLLNNTNTAGPQGVHSAAQAQRGAFRCIDVSHHKRSTDPFVGQDPFIGLEEREELEGTKQEEKASNGPAWIPALMYHADQNHRIWPPQEYPEPGRANSLGRSTRRFRYEGPDRPEAKDFATMTKAAKYRLAAQFPQFSGDDLMAFPAKMIGRNLFLDVIASGIEAYDQLKHADLGSFKLAYSVAPYPSNQTVLRVNGLDVLNGVWDIFHSLRQAMKGTGYIVAFWCMYYRDTIINNTPTQSDFTGTVYALFATPKTDRIDPNDIPAFYNFSELKYPRRLPILFDGRPEDCRECIGRVEAHSAKDCPRRRPKGGNQHKSKRSGSQPWRNTRGDQRKQGGYANRPQYEGKGKGKGRARY